MSRQNVLTLLGILVALAPFSGLPLTWLSILLPILGVLVVVIAFSLRARRPQAALSHETAEA